ncbi:MAG: hypothetical protein H6737_20710 [Alphaproteobacteria bacterium]|nr:hypothetical protein [Alphaproteobacteria bacterium]
MNTKTLFSLALLVLAGCTAGSDPADGPRVEGRVTDRNGAQARFAGSGTLAAATRVEAHAVGADGALSFFAEAAIDADGAYAVEIPDGAGFVVVQAVDADGAVLGSAVVEPSDDAVRTATPVDVESSVEALVFLEGDADAAHWTETRARIDASTALAVKGAADADAAIADLADAVAASAEARTESWTRAGLDAGAVASARLDAALALSAALDAGDGAAYDAFLEALADAEADAGATPTDRVHTEADASLAFRATLRAHGDTALLDAAAAGSAEAEARAWASASGALLEAAGATQAVVDEANDATLALEAELTASASASAAADAAVAWREEVAGSATVQGSLLGEAVGADLVTEAALDSAVDAAATAAASLDAAVEVTAEASVTGPAFDAEAFATAVVDAMDAHRATVDAQAQTLLVGVPNASASAALIVEAHSSFRGL